MTYDPRAVTDVSGLATKTELDQKANASTVGGLATAVNSKASQSALDAAVASIPAASAVTPPAVSDSGATGDMMPYARANHTHASKARKRRVVGVNTATYTWVYPVPFAAGVIPICNGIVEDPADSATDNYNVQIGTPTNTQCTFRIKRQSSGLLGLLLGALSFNPNPGTVNLHLTAFEP